MTAVCRAAYERYQAAFAARCVVAGISPERAAQYVDQSTGNEEAMKLTVFGATGGTGRQVVQQAVANSDAVISALGPRSNQPVYEISQAMDCILPALKKCGVRRIVMTAGMGVTDPQDRPGLVNGVINLLLALMAQNVVEDMRRAVAKVQASGLDWTVIRAPRLVDKPGGRPLKVGYVGQGLGIELARADFAKALLDAATTGKYVCQMPAISN
jgi:putative NADH-flavin reductase